MPRPRPLRSPTAWPLHQTRAASETKASLLIESQERDLVVMRKALSQGRSESWRFSNVSSSQFCLEMDWTLSLT